MISYSKAMKEALDSNRKDIKALERHRPFYRILDEIKGRFPSNCEFSYQYWSSMEYHFYANKEDDKSIHLLLDEIILSYPMVEKHADFTFNKKKAEWKARYRLKENPFGEGSKPIMVLVVGTEAICEIVVVGEEMQQIKEWDCG